MIGVIAAFEYLYPGQDFPSLPDPYHISQLEQERINNRTNFTPSPAVQTQLNNKQQNQTIGDLIGLKRPNAGFILPYSSLAQEEVENLGPGSALLND